MKRWPLWCFAVVLCGVAFCGHAVEPEIPGLITDRTVSSVGHDFYRDFAEKWDTPFDGNLSVNEKPSARWGSWITITLDQDVIYQTFLFPSRRGADKEVQMAIAQTNEALQQRQIDKALLSTGDLTGDEF
ncbi:Curli production assembly/transport component CsgE [Cronobacter condimenti 1330]|uniref:Curli production assembly/transport component CsgE n=1 Tax=Cronobacter condimenti 1330 TaxID=1073999 RepID=K8A6X1_9ENTR|nr:curli production assembly/transport protein CsgE [Cronobacter condimenti]ALB62365.1 curli assembly protein CsgE [Cronobacter condimenti 1330]CCJ71399.1 Curli production assembly/transport component CsgE [Cronobacter condimenti 1330]